MSSREEEDAWRAIVDNYGERARLDDVDLDLANPEPPAAAPRPLVEPAPAQPVHPPEPEEERFVPPPAPPVGRPHGPRLVAWAGVLGVPVLLVVTMIARVVLPSSLTALLVVWFLGGFLWLVSQMPRQRDDPWDDGAVL